MMQSSNSSSHSEAGGGDAVPSTMEAWCQHRYGGPEALRRERVPVPEVAGDQVLVRVAATSINAADRYIADPALLMRPMVGGLRGPKAPIGGLDVAGTVVAVGADVTRFAVGDEVFGDCGGGFGRYAVSAADVLAPAPTSLSLVDAAGVPVAALTALQGLRDHGHVERGSRVLVNGASGGVGTFAVQVAVALGAHVAAVCSTKNMDSARSLGASEVVDYTTTDVIDHFAGRGETFDIVFDVAGVHTTKQRAQLLAPGGRCVFVGAPSGGRILGPIRRLIPSMIAGKFRRAEFVAFVAQANGDDMATLAEMIDAGQIRTVVDEVVPFDELPTALGRFRQGHVAGKIVVQH